MAGRPPRPPRRRLGWLGPAIALAGAAVAGLAVWYMVRAKPQVGAVIDTIRIDDRAAFVVRAEAGGDRNFVELRDGDRLVWRALVPPYAGRPGAPGIAWNQIAVSVRVLRDRRAEVFALSMHDAAKLGGFKLAPGHGPAVIAARGPVTLTDHVRSYEIVGGDGWHQLVAFDLATGEGAWKQELGPAPIDDGGIEAGAAGGTVWLLQAGRRRAFRVTDGTEIVPSSS
ncbi:MAG TPA: hypothetical protein VNO30_45210 [Kofleriaceae bacterium]|nr:hypothetical protein [Kofleriaceae bacterium]